MKIEVDPRDLMSPEVVKKTEEEARKAGLPFEIYVFKQYDSIQQDGVITAPAKIVYGTPTTSEPPTQKEKPSIELMEESENPFDVLELTEFGRGGTRAYNLLSEKFMNIESILELSQEELENIPGFGKSTAEVVFQQLAAKGFIEDDGSTEEESAVEEPVEHEPKEAAEQPEEGEEKTRNRYRRELRELASAEVTTESVSEACRIFQNAWELQYDTAKTLISELIGDVYDRADEDTYHEALQILEANLPMTELQREDIMDTAWELGEDEQATQERAIALTGNEFDEITVEQADQILLEIQADSEADEVQVDDDFSF